MPNEKQSIEILIAYCHATDLEIEIFQFSRHRNTFFLFPEIRPLRIPKKKLTLQCTANFFHVKSFSWAVLDENQQVVLGNCELKSRRKVWLFFVFLAYSVIKFLTPNNEWNFRSAKVSWSMDGNLRFQLSDKFYRAYQVKILQIVVFGNFELRR